MEKSIPTWRMFEDLVIRVLTKKGFQVRVHELRGDKGFDLLGTLVGERWAIEVKYYRTTRAQPTLIDSAATRLLNNAQSARAQRGMLVVSCVVPTQLGDKLEQKFGIALVDRLQLRNWASEFPELLEELDALLETDPREAQSIPPHQDTLRESRPLMNIPPPPRDTRGTELCDELKAMPRGKIAWRRYEKLCEKILRYLFPNDLHGWHEQKRTDDGLNRYDFVCRVKPTTEFWKFVIDHLDSRYALFEFKNYTGKIKQGQILTTEKYLLERGLRRLAIIMSRIGATREATAMTQGAMREHGKLMLVVNDQNVCEMLHMKEQGEDPTDCLFDLADDFLLTLPR